MIDRAILAHGFDFRGRGNTPSCRGDAEYEMDCTPGDRIILRERGIAVDEFRLVLGKQHWINFVTVSGALGDE